MQQFAQQFLGSALGASGSSGDKVQDHWGMPGFQVWEIWGYLLLPSKEEVSSINFQELSQLPLT